eukprot:233713-Chlamydomonas_euryale.AAC.1
MWVGRRVELPRAHVGWKAGGAGKGRPATRTAWRATLWSATRQAAPSSQRQKGSRKVVCASAHAASHRLEGDIVWCRPLPLPSSSHVNSHTHTHLSALLPWF